MQHVRAVLAKMSRLDRRWIFLAMGVAVILPFFLPVQFGAKPSQHTKRFAAALDQAIAADAPIILCVDFGPQSMAELEPLTLAVMNRLFFAKKPVIVLTLYPEAEALLNKYLKDMERRYDLKYGTDYAFLGVAGVPITAIYTMSTSIGDYFRADARGNPLATLPIMCRVGKLKDASAVIAIASNTHPQFWITYAVSPYDINFLMAVTAVQATSYFPFLQSGQVKGILAGGRAAAEYEGLLLERGILQQPGDATRSLGSYSLAMGAIALFIVLGNLGHLAARTRPRSGR